MNKSIEKRLYADVKFNFHFSRTLEKEPSCSNIIGNIVVCNRTPATLISYTAGEWGLRLVGELV